MKLGFAANAKCCSSKSRREFMAADSDCYPDIQIAYISAQFAPLDLFANCVHNDA